MTLAEPNPVAVRPIRMRHFLGPVLAALLLAGCGSSTEAPVATDDPTSTPPTSAATEAERNDLPSSPPPIRLLLPSGNLEAAPMSSCWSSGDGSTLCADRVANALGDLPDVGSRATLDFAFPIPGAEFTAYLTPVLGGVGADATVTAVDLGDGTWRLSPDAEPGRYRVTVEGRVEPGGEAPGEFVWTIPG